MRVTSPVTVLVATSHLSPFTYQPLNVYPGYLGSSIDMRLPSSSVNVSFAEPLAKSNTTLYFGFSGTTEPELLSPSSELVSSSSRLKSISMPNLFKRPQLERASVAIKIKTRMNKEAVLFISFFSSNKDIKILR